MKLSMWSNFYHDLSYENSLKKIKENGFNYSELSDSHFLHVIKENEFEDLIEFKKNISIQTPQLHAPICSIYENPEKDVIERLVDFADSRKEIREREVNCILQWIDYCKIVGIECIVVHPGGLKGYEQISEYKRIEELNIECFKKIAEKCEKEKKVLH